MSGICLFFYSIVIWGEPLPTMAYLRQLKRCPMLRHKTVPIRVPGLQIYEANKIQLARAKEQVRTTRELLHTLNNRRTVQFLLMEEIHEHFLELTELRKAAHSQPQTVIRAPSNTL